MGIKLQLFGFQVTEILDKKGIENHSSKQNGKLVGIVEN
jgi:hypothetical protein